MPPENEEKVSGGFFMEKTESKGDFFKREKETCGSNASRLKNIRYFLLLSFLCCA